MNCYFYQLQNHAKANVISPTSGIPGACLSRSTKFTRHQSVANVVKRNQMPPWYSLSAETIDISETWPLPHFVFHSQVVALDWQDLVTFRTYHKRSWRNMAFSFLASSIQESMTREVNIPSFWVLTSVHFLYTFYI